MKFLPIAQRWGGEPSAEERMVEGYWCRVSYPSTMLRMIPLPTGCAGREEPK
jgi:hypothetical protein